jgi:hypothetical protein
VIAEIKALRRGNTLGKGVTIRDLIDEGRRLCLGSGRWKSPMPC